MPFIVTIKMILICNNAQLCNVISDNRTMSSNCYDLTADYCINDLKLNYKRTETGIYQCNFKDKSLNN